MPESTVPDSIPVERIVPISNPQSDPLVVQCRLEATPVDRPRHENSRCALPDVTKVFFIVDLSPKALEAIREIIREEVTRALTR